VLLQVTDWDGFALAPICDPSPQVFFAPPLYLHPVVRSGRLLIFVFLRSRFCLCLPVRQAAAVVAHLVRSGKMGGGFAKCFVSKLREHSPVK